MGCGIGGPMRTVARFFKYKVRIEGINITEEHIQRARRYNRQQNVANCTFIHGDFNEVPRPDNYYDAIYDFEATLHSTDLDRTFAEIYRLLKPGGRYVTAQYCLLDGYDPDNEHHRDVIRRVDNTNGCYCAGPDALAPSQPPPALPAQRGTARAIAGRTVALTTAALQNAGFSIEQSTDVFDRSNGCCMGFEEVFASTKGGRFMGTKLGLLFTICFTWTGEKLRLLPRGTYQVQKMLVGAAESFTEAGQLNLLTPGQLFVCEKPAKATKAKK